MLQTKCLLDCLKVALCYKRSSEFDVLSDCHGNQKCVSFRKLQSRPFSLSAWSEDASYRGARLKHTEAFRLHVLSVQPQPPHLPVPLAVLALLADPVDGVEVVIRPHTRDGLL